MAKSPIKVTMVCHFSNVMVRERLPLGNRRLYSLARRLLRLPGKGNGYGDVAAWNTYMIEQLRKRDDIELYVISAHSGLNRRVCSFEMHGVHYNFVRCDRATMLKHIIPSAYLWHKLNPMRPVVRKIINQIKPDLIVLVGAENPHVAGTVLGIEGYPLIVKCQTIYNNPDRAKFGKVDEKNAYVEKKIFENLQYVSVSGGMHYNLFRQMNQTAINFSWRFGNLYPEVKVVPKQYDFVNFAMGMSDKKGYYDAIKALAIVKERYPHVQLNLVGGASPEKKQTFVNLVKQLDLSSNVTFTPFFPLQEDMFQHIQQSRFALLPCKLDSVPSTIRQAMHYGIPVVCYKTVGTPTLNKERECVLIAENGNVEDLALKMLTLLDNAEKAEQLRKNAKEYIDNRTDDSIISQQMSDVFHAVVNNYRYGTPIPEELISRPGCNEKKQN